MEEATPYDLNRDLYYLLKDEPFFATFSRNINKTSSTAIPTAGVRNYDSDAIPYQPTAEDEEAYADWLEYLAREAQNANARA